MARPIKVFKMYPMQVAIFQGEKGFSAVCNKSQKSKESGQYEDSSMFFPSELPTMAKLMGMAFEWIANQERPAASCGGGYGQSSDGPVPF